MTHDEATVERVARAICWSVTGGEHDLNARDMAGNRLRDQWQDYERHARAALSAMPSAALLREALEALAPFAKTAGEFDDQPEDQWQEAVFWADGQPIGYRLTVGDTRRARAAADKIRAALEHQQKGEGL